MNKTLSGCLQELKNKGKVQLGVQKWSRSLTGVVAYESLSHSSNRVSQRWL